MRIDLGLVLRYVTGVAEKVNAVNYLSKPPSSTDEFYYEENSYALNEKTIFIDQTSKAPIRRIGTKVKEIKRESHYVRDGNYNRDNNFNQVTMVAQMIGVGSMFHFKIEKLPLGMVEALWRELKICCRK